VNVWFHVRLEKAPSAIGGGIGKKKRKRKRASTHEVPPLLSDGIRLAFCDEAPHKLGHGRARRVQFKVEREVVRGRVEEVDEPPENLRRELEEIVPRAQGEDGVQGGDAPSARREGEEVAVAVRGQRGGAAPACRRGARELLLEDVQVRVEPVLCVCVCMCVSECIVH